MAVVATWRNLLGSASPGSGAKAATTSSPSATLPDDCELGGPGTQRHTVAPTRVIAPPIRSG